MALAQRLELIEYQLHAHAHELHQFRQRRFVGFRAVGGVDAGARDLGQVAHDLAQIAGQALRIGGAVGAQPVEKAGAPGGQRLGALLDRALIRRESADRSPSAVPDSAATVAS